MIAANDVPEREIARLAGILAHDAGADFAIKVLGNISRALAPMALTQRVDQRRSAPQEMEAVVRAVAARYSIPVEKLMGPSRERWTIHARQEAYARCYALHKGGHGPFSLPAVARFFSRDHSTILHGIRAHEQRAGER